VRVSFIKLKGRGDVLGSSLPEPTLRVCETRAVGCLEHVLFRALISSFAAANLGDSDVALACD
jgi:hypothetical protein